MAYDPRPNLIKLQGKDYLQVMHRIVWFRDVHPDGSIVTEMISHPLEGDECVFKATVSWYDRETQQTTVAVGWGSESKRDFGDFREKAETKALGRALAHAGFGTQFAGLDFEESTGFSRIADSPVPAPAQNDEAAAGRRVQRLLQLKTECALTDSDIMEALRGYYPEMHLAGNIVTVFRQLTTEQATTIANWMKEHAPPPDYGN